MNSRDPLRSAAEPARSNVDVTFVTDEGDAAMDIVRSRAAAREPTTAEWAALSRSQGYAHLKEREAYLGRSFTDSSFESFLTSDSLAARLPDLARVSRCTLGGLAPHFSDRPRDA
ncbi:MAG: hypothetical protein ACHQQP_07605 [Gemmatimonadales bacterium]